RRRPDLRPAERQEHPGCRRVRGGRFRSEALHRGRLQHGQRLRGREAGRRRRLRPHPALSAGCTGRRYRMDIRYSCNQKDFKRYTTEEMRDEMRITGLYKADEVVAVYSHVDRMVTLGCMPVNEVVPIDKGIDIWANFGTHYFLERREIGMFNIGKDSTGIVVADGVRYELGYKDCLYITQGTKEVTFASADPAHPA